MPWILVSTVESEDLACGFTDWAHLMAFQKLVRIVNLLLSFDQKRLLQIVFQTHQIEYPKSNLLLLLHLESVPISEMILFEPFWIHQNHEIRLEGMKVCIFGNRGPGTVGQITVREELLNDYEINQGGEFWRRRTNSEWLRNQIFPLFWIHDYSRKWGNMFMMSWIHACI